MTTEQANQLKFIYDNINKLDLDLLNNPIEVTGYTDPGTWTTQTIHTPLDSITAFYMYIDGHYGKYSILNFFDNYSINNGGNNGDIWKDGSDIKINYRTSGIFNCGLGTGKITLFVL